MILRFVGDVHGNMQRYWELTEDCEHSLQVGDFGAGFVPMPPSRCNHKFLRGNHDNPQVCADSDMWVKDGTLAFDKVFCIGGAYSIDKHMRIPGLNWWPEEELTREQQDIIADAYEALRPEIVATHDCPTVAFPLEGKEPFYTSTQSFLDTLFAFHKPKLWVFGHYHVSMRKEIQGTNFVCLNIEETLDIKLD